MKKYSVIISLLVFIHIINTGFAQPLKETELKKDQNLSTKTADSHSFQIFFRADTFQTKSTDGLQFSLVIRNNSSTDVQIRNPADLLTFNLVNSTGRGASLIGFSHLQRTALQRKDIVLKKIKYKNKSDTLYTRELTLPANDEIEMHFKINKTMKGPDKKGGIEYVFLPKDSYKLFIICTLTSPTTGQFSDKFVLPPFKIQYGD